MFTAMTYNVHAWVGCSGRRGCRRAAGVLARLRPDVAALQEVVPEAQGRALERSLGWPVLYGPTLTKDRTPFGNALVTPHPVLEVRRWDLSVAGREPRGALDVLLMARGLRLRVVATHLGLDAMERRHQARALLEVMARPMPGPPPDLELLLGDCNEWRPFSFLARRLGREMAASPPWPTFPARLPILPLDRMWWRPRPARASFQVLRGRDTRLASDHLPLWGEFNL